MSARLSRPRSRVQTVEVVVVGAGPAGLALAAALGSAGVETALVDRLGPEDEGGTDLRTTAVMEGPINILKGIGVWPALAPEAAPLVRMRIVNDRRGLVGGAEVLFDAREADAERFGYNLSNRGLRQSLAARVADLTAVTHLRSVSFVSLEADAAAASVRLDDGRRIEAALVVGADGRASPVRAAAGIGVRSRRYGQTAIVCTLAHEREHEDTSTEFHRPGGPLTLVPLRGRRSALVWVERDPDAAALLAMDEAGFEAALKTQTRARLGGVRLETERQAFPVGLTLAERHVGVRVALVAEAAHALPPIGAQGFNLSLRDVATLAELIVDARTAGEDCGGRSVLTAYEARRRPDACARAAAVDGLNRTTSSESALLRGARDVGLRALRKVRPIRSLLMRTGLRAVGPEPRLADK